ncbi:MAG: zinc-dependent metalloprotease [Flavobacteriaceae bacterium]|nr:zinc-dependent metalloprotease [Flavobacteriaceae bacterium]MDP4673853.1 zinc-dependent metalloprotease [Flavobacteriaceae bacterium]MDP4754639.1 zinc-dependent metalloprotease [Flavobacteriaceae bacterium]MDP4794616.1 zinc-dependent metalloprotease [Flavobacteriaceae bacterium]MDP4885452.1 zinc-dependent metalloprotease [Flavobacteriaceae bacterium]
MRRLLLLTFFMAQTISAQWVAKNPQAVLRKGYFDTYYDAGLNRLYARIPQERLKESFLYVYSLSQGIGSNDIGLDRGQLGNEQVVYFEQRGQRVFLVQPNLAFRALTNNPLEKASVEQAFAKSVRYGFEVKGHEKGDLIIELTDFLLQDAHGVSARLASAKQGSYSLDLSKSALNSERTKSFPKNIEMDVMLTFKGTPTGAWIRSVTPEPGLVTVFQHHSFIELPDDQYTPRAYDPRSGAYPFSYMDYATPVDQPIVKKWITRHRLVKKDPQAAVSEPVKPIIYYLDNGTPEPIRTALLDGGAWWNEAFEAAGFKNAFRVEVLPDSIDPLDVRYHVIQWVHRSTRGWSYGSSITDPRTGEIIKGHVSLGSLRIRQDYMIAQALSEQPFASASSKKALMDFALSRIRQLSAHEIGHTLGFAHNYAASTRNKSSVMDYPHPQLSLVDGKVSLDNAYETGIGTWDKVTVAYAYSTVAPGEDQEKALTQILDHAYTSGLRYLTDQDARPASSPSASAHLWDNGMDVVDELSDMLAVRKTAMNGFSWDNLEQGTASGLEDVFVPLFFWHRYQTEAVAKQLGALTYAYQVKGGVETDVAPLSADAQRKALNGLFSVLDAEQLAIPADKLGLFPPRVFGDQRGRESFKSQLGSAFDPFTAAVTAADIAFGFMFQPERIGRVVQQKWMDDQQLGLDELLDKTSDYLFSRQHASAYHQSIQEMIGTRYLSYVYALSVHESVFPQVRLMAQDHLAKLSKSWVNKKNPESVHSLYLNHLKSLGSSASAGTVSELPDLPDGPPIGSDDQNFLNCGF